MRNEQLVTYAQQVKQDCLVFLESNYDITELLNDNCGEIEDVFEYLYDTLWCEDAVTGNGSGSYFFDYERAKQMVLANIEEVVWAMFEFDCIDTLGRRICQNEWEWLDVTARCYQLHNALREAMIELGWMQEE